MKSHKISVSRHDLTRCASCSRHHHIDRTLDAKELWVLTCDFCGGQLLHHEARHDTHFNARPEIAKRQLFGARSSKIALGLLGASLTMAACEDEEPVNRASAGVDMVLAGDDAAYAEYGAFPAGELPEPGGESAGEAAGESAGTSAGETAGVEMAPAGDDSAQPEYGAFPAGVESGEEAGEMAGVEMMTAGDGSFEPDYGSFPAGEEG
jgi:hypothetical protein